MLCECPWFCFVGLLKDRREHAIRVVQAERAGMGKPQAPPGATALRRYADRTCRAPKSVHVRRVRCYGEHAKVFERPARFAVPPELVVGLVANQHATQ